ncbi:hypothetical protein ABTY35_35190 [Streptomyces fimicarius]|uniref:NucA/NucB deoxyribonuclease domain-containing protein n=1 Tax=Streptomyces TaxID=1883 RepID=UPI0009974566|nr:MULTISPECIES: hypothetical protein [Streptomyces]WKN14583.1 hypothetical protein NEH83_10375 [Streptomyces sp. JUS-F4]
MRLKHLVLATLCTTLFTSFTTAAQGTEEAFNQATSLASEAQETDQSSLPKEQAQKIEPEPRRQDIDPPIEQSTTFETPTPQPQGSATDPAYVAQLGAPYPTDGEPGDPLIDAASSETKKQAQARVDYVAEASAHPARIETFAAASVPPSNMSFCWDAPYGGKESLVVDHWAWCKKFNQPVHTFRCNPGCTPTGAVTFRFTFMGIGHKGPTVADRSMRVMFMADLPSITGAPSLTTRLGMSADCKTNTPQGSCLPDSRNGVTRTLQEWISGDGLQSALFDFTSDSGVLTGDKLVFHEHSFKATVTSDIVDSNTYGGESFRCDSATYIGSAHGCVYDQVIETFTLVVDSDVQDSADLIWSALNTPDKTFPVSESNKYIPGTVGSGSPLVRLPSSQKEQNHTHAVNTCKKYWGDGYTKGQTLDCDEYPFQSTRQGAKTGGSGTSHYAVKPLNKKHNQKAGSRLESFYKAQRILYVDDRNDRFYVELRNPDGSKYQGPAPGPSGVAANVEYRQCPNSDLPEVKEIQANAAPEQLFNSYARSTPDGWTGGDSTYSFDLPDGRRLFLFSDTFLGPENSDGTRPTTSKFVNSSFLVQNGNSLSTITGGSKTKPTGFMPPAIDNRWFWLGDGMIANIDGSQYLQIMFQEYRGTGDGSAMPFEFVRNVVATFELSDLTKPKWIDPLPSATGAAWGSALLPASRSGDGYTYIYGVSDDQTNKKMRIARVKGSDLSKVDDWQFFRLGLTENTWMRGETEGNEYLEGVSNEYSVTPWNGQFVVISQDSTLAFNNKIRIWSGCDPFGAFGYWDGNDEVYRMPETGPWGSYGDPNIFAYNAHAHPTLQSGDRWTLSYNVNSFDNRWAPEGALFRDVSIYKPRFVSFRLVPSSGASRMSKQFVLE